MDNTRVQLFGTWASPFCHRVQLALKIKGVDFEYVEEDLSNKSPLLQRYNPVHLKVPVLLHGEKPIAESSVILEYIDETWKGDHNLLPEDTYGKAVVRFWSHFSQDKIGPAVGTVFRSIGEEQREAVEQVSNGLKLVEVELREGFFKGSKFFGGDKIGMLDIVLGCGSHWICAFDEVAGVKLLDQQTFPRLHSWLCDFEELPEVKESIPTTDKLIKYAKEKRRMFLDSSKPEYALSKGN